MPICQKCEERFPNRMEIEGKIKNLQRRKYCLDCSPFGQHNTKKIHVEPHNTTEKKCPRCTTIKPIEMFYNRRGLKGGSVYCKQCHSDQVTERQRRFKEECAKYKGGKCSNCDYDNYIGALEFHHIDPSDKDFSPSQCKLTKFSNKIKKELDKCILLCSNCHREEHARLNGLL
jgi:5-methylcytosine-specific restriction endonuclease McrA